MPHRNAWSAVWSTPIGFVKGAMANNATTKGNTVSFTVGGKYKFEGTINGQGQVEKVRTWIDQPIVGDMLIETTYTGYKDFGGVLYPSRMVQTQDGYPALDITVSGVTANPAVDIDVPAERPRVQPPPIRGRVAEAAEGVYYLTGGTHHSLAIEMADHIVVVDTPNTRRAARQCSRRQGTHSQQADPLRRRRRITIGIISADPRGNRRRAPRS
jgi:hypothetical protein